MPSEVCIALKALFPPGSLPEDDEALERLIAGCSEEFEVVLEKALAVTAGTPDSAIFRNRWEAIGLSKPRKTLEDTAYGAFSVRNTLAHLNFLIPGVSVKIGEGNLFVTGINNVRVLASSGSARAGDSIAKIIRDQAKIDIIESTKHAHVKAVYEEMTCIE